MKIVLVIDQFDDANNGTTISARRFAQALKNHGNEVRVIATGKPADYKYAVRQMRFFPVVEHLITSQGMRLAIPNRHVFEKAAAWADVVHFMMPSPLGIMGLKHVEKLGIPHTAAFHCQPENITFTLHMGNSRRVNDFVYNRFRDTFFNRFTHIHCPSNMIANQLRQHGYTARLHVISNGISPEYIYGKREKEPWMQGLFNVLMVGRYAGEKRQDELIDACAKSRHAGAENEKVAAHQALVDGQPGRAGLIPDGHGQVQGRTRVRDLHLPAGEHCDGAPRGLYGFDIHQNPPDRGGRPGGCRKTGSLSCQGAQRNCAVPAPISKWYLAMPRSTLV